MLLLHVQCLPMPCGRGGELELGRRKTLAVNPFTASLLPITSYGLGTKAEGTPDIT
jgi:hypothetical protein